ARKCRPLGVSGRGSGELQIASRRMTLAFAGDSRLPPQADADRAGAAATRALLACRQSNGHWVFELEADATIPAEYVLLRHYRGEPIDSALEQKIANYLRRIQGAHD